MCRIWCLESLSIARSISVNPPSSLIFKVEKLVCAPAPFQSPCWIHYYNPNRFHSFPSYLHGLRIHWDDDPKFLSGTMKEETGHPQIITHANAFARSHLELPLCRHNLGIGARDIDSGVEACAIMSLDNVTTIDLVGAHPTIVGSLWPGKSIFGPAKGMVVLVQQSVFLFDSEPGFFLFGSFHDFKATFAMIGLRRLLVVLEGFAKDKFVIP